MNLDNLKGVNKTIGVKQTMKAINRGEAAMVFVASDGESRVIGPLLSLCEAQSVSVNREYTMSELGKACRIKVKAAAVGVLS